MPQGAGLFDDDAEKFLFSGAQEQFKRFAQIDVFARIVDARFVNFNAALLDQSFRFGLRWSEFQIYKQCSEFSCRPFRQLHDWRFDWRLAVAEDALEIGSGFAGGVFAVEAANYFLGKAHFRVL